MTAETNKLNKWTSEKRCRRLVNNLAKRGFTALYCDNTHQAVEYILKQAENADTIGFGGSLSVSDTGVEKRLDEMGKKLLNHGPSNMTPQEKHAMRQRQLTCDLFLTGTNAVTLDGHLVNIDGTGNRVAAMIYGPAKVIVVVGCNKIVEGDIPAAIRRIKEKSAPPNAMRIKRDTPCAKTGFCEDCDSEQRICNVTTVFDRKPSQSDVHVVVVNEEMGL